MTNRISLTEAARRAPRITARGDSRLLEEGAPPTLADLAGALQFALGDGRIWLSDERMVMMQTRVLGHLRREVIQSLGIDAARSLFYRTGWLQGKQYAELVRKRFNQQDLTAALAAGPRIHTMEGFVKVTTKRFEFDIARGHYHGEFHWHDSTEATEHLAHFGLSDCPTCWMQVGAPAGFTTALLGQPVIFREVECAGQGAERCVVIGRNAAAWGPDVPELEEFGRAPSQSRSQPWKPPVDPLPDRVPDMPHTIIGRSTGIERARRLLERVAGYDQPVMFLGEAGTGKEYFARRLHDIGRTPKGPFVAVNCGAYGEGQSDPPLFGPQGALERATGGTLFLNDVFSLPAALQSRLAVHLGEGRLPLRIVSASAAVPKGALETGRFRSDLYFRLSLLPIVIPPLRDRRDDLPMLIDHFLRQHGRAHGKPLRTISGAALDLLLRYGFPGNVRELSNMIERGVIYAEPGGDLDISHIFTGVEQMPEFVEGLHSSGRIIRKSPSDPTELPPRPFTEVEADAYRAALEAANGNVSAAARALGLTRAKLDYRLSKLGLNPQLFSRGR
ncbi:MAG: XylR N-terminal domain-containing protein [Rhodobacteraceae bacterium]|nr:XylR N-terminal domain-containing protein [Paracoccaceae bacterium]